MTSALSRKESNCHANLPTLPDGSGRVLERIDDETFEVTTYKGAPATSNELNETMASLMACFPNVTTAMAMEIKKQVIEEKWQAERLHDALVHVKKNCDYLSFGIGKFLGFDKKKRLYNYSGYCNLISEHKAVHEDFGTIKIDGRPYWYLIHENI